MKNKRNITINVIQDNTINNYKLAMYFAEKYREEMKGCNYKIVKKRTVKK